MAVVSAPYLIINEVKYSIFFFSSRRRHTRCSRDWSSDVCSSDLTRCDRLQLSIRSDHLAELQGDRVRGEGRTSDLGGNTVPSRAGQRRHGSVREFLSKGSFRDRGAGTPRTI